MADVAIELRGAAVWLRARGYLETEDCESIVARLREHIAQGATELVFVMTDATGLASEARRTLQELLSEKRSVLTGVTLVGANPLVKMAGSVMSMVSGVPIAFVQDDTELT